jgi:tetratricopeptide (TPR) repeat protein
MALAEANYRSKTYPIALSEFNKAIEMDSSIYRQGPIHYKMAQAHLNMRNIPAAIEEYKLDLQINPNDTVAWMELAKIYQIAGNVPQAAFCYEKYTSLVPDNGQAWFDLGKLYLHIQDQEKAAMSFERAVELKSNVAESFGQLAKIYSDRKEFERSLDAYRRYEAEFGAPDSVQYWFEKGKVMMKMGEKNAPYFDSAMTAFERASAIDPTFTDAFEYAGLAMYYQKDYKRAIWYFNKVLAIDSTNINAYRNLAFAYLKIDDYANATRAFRKVLELKSEDVMIRAMLARIYSFRENFTDAVQQYEIILNGKNGQVSDSLRCEIYPDLGYDYLKLGKCQSSIPILLNAEKCKSNDVTVLLNIAASYQLCNSIKEANSYYKKVLAIEPKNKVAIRGEMETRLQSEG